LWTNDAAIKNFEVSRDYTGAAIRMEQTQGAKMKIEMTHLKYIDASFV
jgi:hypothetical protein